jgi:hypothetical protein
MVRRDGGRERRGPLARGGLMAALLLLNLTALSALFIAGVPTTSAAAASPLGSISIKVPRVSSGVAQGPVGANVSVEGTGIADHTYQLGYATTDSNCATGISLIPGTTIKASSAGAFSKTFSWPASAGGRGTSYYVCAQDTAPIVPPTPSIQSTDLFKVSATDAPSIDVSAAPVTSTAPAGGPVPTPPDGHFFAGSRVQIVGTNFLPANTQLEAYYTLSGAFSPADPQNFRPLTTDAGGTTFTSQNNGGVAVTVTLPNAPIGQVYLHVVSKDYVAGKYPPSMVATQQIQVDRAPTPTPPTASPSVQITPSVTAGGGNGGGSNSPDPARVLAVVGLTGLSIILFIVGIILMTSASAMAGQRRRGI